jgi:hypothetical protein
MYNNIMNRDLFQRYARQPRPQAPAAPSGIMASSPELMQASMRYQQGGMVQPPVAQPRVNPQFRPDLMRYQQGGGVDANPPTFMGDVVPYVGGVLKDVVTGIPDMARKAVDITQTPTEFKETVTEKPADGNLPTSFGFTAEGVDQEVKKFVDDDAVKQAEKAGEAVISGDVTPENVPPELEDALKKVQDPDASNPEKAGAILGAAGVEVPKGTKGKIAAMKKLISEAYGVDPSRYDNLRSLNRAMVGFTIAEGGDIATALKQGAAGAAKIEETQLAREDAITEAAIGQTFAEKNAALKAAAKAPKTFLDTPEGEAAVKIYQDYLKSNLSEADARAKVNEISPGLGDRVAAAIAGGVPAAQPEPAKLSPAPPATLKAAQDAIAAGADQNAVVERLNKQGYNAEGL